MNTPLVSILFNCLLQNMTPSDTIVFLESSSNIWSCDVKYTDTLLLVKDLLLSETKFCLLNDLNIHAKTRPHVCWSLCVVILAVMLHLQGMLVSSHWGL